MSAKSRAEVLIVGAGPTGLTLAITLRRFGVPVRIVDRAAQSSAVSKALAVWSASLEALEGMEVIDEFLADGERLRALSVGDGSRELAELAVGIEIMRVSVLSATVSAVLRRAPCRRRPRGRARAHISAWS